MLVRPDFRRSGERAALVLGVGVCVDEDDRQRLRAALAQRLRRRGDTGFVDRRANGAVGERAFIDFHAQIAIGDRDELAPQAPGLPAVAAAHFEHVAKAARGDHADARAAPFKERIGADGGAVHDRAEALDGAERQQALQKAGRFIAALRRHLGDAEGARRVIEVKQIGERAADIDADDRPTSHAHARASPRKRAVAAASILPSSPTATP